MQIRTIFFFKKKKVFQKYDDQWKTHWDNWIEC